MVLLFISGSYRVSFGSPITSTTRDPSSNLSFSSVSIFQLSKYPNLTLHPKLILFPLQVDQKQGLLFGWHSGHARLLPRTKLWPLANEFVDEASFLLIGSQPPTVWPVKKYMTVIHLSSLMKQKVDVEGCFRRGIGDTFPAFRSLAPIGCRAWFRSSSLNSFCSAFVRKRLRSL